MAKHVHAEQKPDGRRYYVYQRFRNTRLAWPRVKLPMHPMSVEFATKLAWCAQLDAAKSASGAWVWAFIDEGGRRHDLPSPADALAFWDAVSKAAETARQLDAGEHGTFAALITEFKNSSAFRLKGAAPPDALDDQGKPKRRKRGFTKSTQGLAKATREQYARHLRDIEAAWGSDQVRKLTTADAQKAIDAFTDDDLPAAGRIFRATLSRLIDWGIPRGYAETNVVEKTEKPGDGGTYEPWPAWAFEQFFEHAREGLRLAVWSGLFTGQRISDVVKMQRPREGITEMPIVAQKTGATVPLQIHSEYRAIIRETGQTHVMLHLREDGEPWTYEGLKTAWQREMDRDVFKRFREERIVFHGLRKNAVNNLLEVGCSEAQVCAIVKMSPAMVRHYSKRVNDFRLAREGMKGLEAGWGTLRPNVLGKVRVVK